MPLGGNLLLVVFFFCIIPVWSTENSLNMLTSGSLGRHIGNWLRTEHFLSFFFSHSKWSEYEKEGPTSFASSRGTNPPPSSAAGQEERERGRLKKGQRPSGLAMSAQMVNKTQIYIWKNITIFSMGSLLYFFFLWNNDLRPRNPFVFLWSSPCLV